MRAGPGGAAYLVNPSSLLAAMAYWLVQVAARFNGLVTLPGRRLNLPARQHAKHGIGKVVCDSCLIGEGREQRYGRGRCAGGAGVGQCQAGQLLSASTYAFPEPVRDAIDARALPRRYGRGPSVCGSTGKAPVRIAAHIYLRAQDHQMPGPGPRRRAGSTPDGSAQPKDLAGYSCVTFP